MHALGGGKAVWVPGCFRPLSYSLWLAATTVVPCVKVFPSKGLVVMTDVADELCAQLFVPTGMEISSKQSPETAKPLCRGGWGGWPVLPMVLRTGS